MLEPSTPNFGARLQRSLKAVGWIILVSGLTSSALIWHAHARDKEVLNDPADPMAPLATSDSRKQSRQVEIYYGKTGLLFERWSEKAAELSHGKPLAEMVFGISLIAALGCFFVSSRVVR
ncbi:MAG TPA: hypothetical protein VFE51_02365 [Verrucomicrobiae bacterium]|nr:hypothetical protein [Verrucomicrobiae bacterium]